MVLAAVRGHAEVFKALLRALISAQVSTDAFVVSEALCKGLGLAPGSTLLHAAAALGHAGVVHEVVQQVLLLSLAHRDTRARVRARTHTHIQSRFRGPAALHPRSPHASAYHQLDPKEPAVPAQAPPLPPPPPTRSPPANRPLDPKEPVSPHSGPPTALQKLTPRLCRPSTRTRRIRHPPLWAPH